MKKDTLLLVLSGFLLIVGTLGLIVLQQPLSGTSFDIRNQAAEVKKCNEGCTANGECQVNQFCFQNHCRLATNPQNEVCVDPPDMGLSFACDEYCADARECADEFVCVENRCRRPSNPDDAGCKLSDQEIADQIAKTCNNACSTHSDCSANMRCYGGFCRLVSNPANIECQAATPTVVLQKTTIEQDTDSPKGGVFSPTIDTAKDGTQAAEIIDQELIASDESLLTNQYLQAPPANIKSTEELPMEEKNALDTLINELRRSGSMLSLLPIIALGVGGLLLLVVIIPKLFKNKNQLAKKAIYKVPSDDNYEQQLQTKLEELKQQTTQSKNPGQSINPAQPKNSGSISVK